MSMDRRLTAPARSEANCGSRTRLPLHPTGNSAGRFAPCLVRIPLIADTHSSLIADSVPGDRGQAE
jgi:hypothetical protein